MVSYATQPFEILGQRILITAFLAMDENGAASRGQCEVRIGLQQLRSMRGIDRKKSLRDQRRLHAGYVLVGARHDSNHRSRIAEMIRRKRPAIGIHVVEGDTPLWSNNDGWLIGYRFDVVGMRHAVVHDCGKIVVGLGLQ